MTDIETDDLIADSVARLFGKQVNVASRLRVEAGEFDTDLWQRVVDGGFHTLMATELAGGSALSWTDAYPVLRGLGYWQAPIPLAETMVASLLASLAGFALPPGPITMIEQGEGNRLQVGTGGTLNGVVHGVLWARHSRAVLVALADDRIGLLDLKTAGGVTVQAHANHAGLPSDTLSFDNARLDVIGANPVQLSRPVWTLGAAARSAMLVGALESALEQSVHYAGERIQFGKPIGKNQAIQQNLAVMAGDVAAARIAALVAMADAPDALHPSADGTIASFSAAVAKVRASEAASRGAAIAHQVHGAIGFTHEHSLHFATRRLWAWREEFGTDAQWAAELGRAAIRARGDAFWSSLTSKRFTARPEAISASVTPMRRSVTSARDDPSTIAGGVIQFQRER